LVGRARARHTNSVEVATSVRTLATTAMALLLAACQTSTSPNPSTQVPPAPRSSSFAVTFGDNPVPFRSTGCNASTPQGWYTTARVQETSGVPFTPATLVQKLDGNTTSLLTESFGSRFGACPGGTFDQGVIPANGAVCGSIGVCTSNRFGSYQFQFAGTDANGHSITFDSPLLQLSPVPPG
jgi:hypothetical protein